MTAGAGTSPAGAHARRDIVTPEGLPLGFRVAAAGERVGAFALDAVILAIAILVLLFALLILALGTAIELEGCGAGLVAAVGLLALFVARNFYFILFELKWQGATPGKRVMGIRVIDARGGPLTGEAVFARNLTRELETFLPLVALISAESAWPGAPGWARLVALVWLLAFAFLPLVNRDRLRVGDIVAGTLVVRAPKVVLDEDPTERGALVYEFAREQLELYGIYELQVLEGVLRRDGPGSEEARKLVCEKIKTKIAWDRSRWDVDSDTFLREFYTAQRARLEQRMLFGERQERKRPGSLRRKASG